MRFQLVTAALLTAGAALPAHAPAQTSRADTAQVILGTARALDLEGRSAAARELLRFIGRRYAGTPAAADATELLRSLNHGRSAGNGRTGFVVFNTLYGGFLGLAIPAAFGADDTAPYGAGLLVGAPLGLLASRAFAVKHIGTAGQAGIASFATLWGTWQGLGWQQAFDLGSEEICSEFGCFTDESDAAPWGAMIAGGLAGLGTGYLIAATTEIANGTSSLISASSFWGTWFGLALARALDVEDDDLLGASLIGGNVGLLAALPAARAWRPSSSRVRLVSAAGLAGGFVGLGLDLLGDVEDGRTALAIPAATSALGLLVGAIVTRGREDLDPEPAALGTGSLLDLSDGIRVGVPLPLPAGIRIRRPDGRHRIAPAARVTLFSARF